VVANEQLASGDEVDFGALLRLMWRYRVLIVTVTLVCAVIAAVVALLMKPVYRAEVVVTEARDTMDGTGALMGQLGGLASLAGVNLGQDGPGREARAFLQSRTLSEEFIKRYQLLPELYKDSKQPPTMWRAVRKFRDGVLSTREDKIKGTTTIAINWTDAETAARWANDLIALLNELMRTRAMEESKRNVEYLNKQIQETNVVELQRVMYDLIESETKALMLANVRDEYAYRIVDRAVAPEIRIKPKRSLIVLFGMVMGVLAGSLIAFVHNAARKAKIAA
jgi:uncharacterized protein involved in exopolysaccharide biosynthesis